MGAVTKQRNGRAFITGSHAYGRPKSTSDVDLVVLVTEEEKEILTNAAGEIQEMDHQYAGKYVTLSLRFGKLNLLVTDDPDVYDVWVQGTKECKKFAPMPRQDACAVFEELRDAFMKQKESKGE